MSEKSKILTIIVPCYNEEAAIPLFYDEIESYAEVFKKSFNVQFELLFIDDGSKDASLEEIKKLTCKDSCVKFVSFSRNFGKEAAIYAGLEYATGDFVCIMDVDLQDPPSLLAEMYLKITTEQYDCVATRRSTRKGEPVLRSFFARCFYKMINKISPVKIVDGARDFRMMTRAVVDAVLEMKEYNRFSKGIFNWVGFNTFWISYENKQRVAGETKWSFGKLFLYSLDGIFAFSTAPLAISSILGILICVAAFCYMVFVIVKALVFGDPVAGYPSLVTILLFVGGIQLFCIGIMGQYISKLYLETKHRPIYLIKEKNYYDSKNTR